MKKHDPGLRFKAIQPSELNFRSPPCTPLCGMTSDWGPMRYDLNRELEFVRPVHVGATPVTDHPVEPLRGQ